MSKKTILNENINAILKNLKSIQIVILGKGYYRVLRAKKAMDLEYLSNKGKFLQNNHSYLYIYVCCKSIMNSHMLPNT